MLLIIGMPTPTFGSTMSHYMGLHLFKFIHPKLSCKSESPQIHRLMSQGNRIEGFQSHEHKDTPDFLGFVAPLDIFHFAVFAVWVLSPSARIFVSIHGTEICRCAKWLSSYWQGWEIKGDGNWMQFACSAHKLLILSSTFCILVKLATCFKLYFGELVHTVLLKNVIVCL